MSFESNPEQRGDTSAGSKPTSMRLFIFAVLVLVVFNLILFFMLVVAPSKNSSTHPSPSSAETRKP
jgi:hypothetical protein